MLAAGSAEAAMDRPAQRIEITVDEAVALAVDYIRQGRLSEAAVLCEAILQLEPGNAGALHYSGMLAHRRGDHAQALMLMGRSLELVPGQADWYSNLGIVLQANGQLQAAM